MSKVCEECGHQLEANVQECPNCGCPTKNLDTVNSMCSSLSTEVEETFLLEFADAVLKWSKVVAFILSALCATMSFFTGVEMLKWGEAGMGLLNICGGIFIAIVFYVLSFFFAKACWATIRIYVNMSKFLKNINENIDRLIWR